MWFRVAVEAFLPACHFQLAHEAAVGERLQIAVHRGQADVGDALPHRGVEFIRSGMRFRFLQFLEDDLSLIGHA